MTSTAGFQYCCGVSDGTKGVIGGGAAYDNSHLTELQYYTIASTGTATDYGDLLTSNGFNGSATDDGTRGLYGSTNRGGSEDRQGIDYFTIATGGTCQDFGLLAVNRSTAAIGDFIAA